MMQEQIESYCAHVANVLEYEPMAKHTSFRVGGPARLYVTASSKETLLQAVQSAMDLSIPFFLFGGGSNLLVADHGFDGVVIQSAIRNMTITDNHLLQVGSGAITSFIARKSVEAGFTGFEWAVSVPGTVGGAVFGNAGCFGGEMKDVVMSVDVFRLENRVNTTLANSACQFAYRDSIFKREPHAILSITLSLDVSSDKEQSLAKMQSIMQARKGKQPFDQSSAGCVFKNYEWKDEEELSILRREVDEIPLGMLTGKRLGAGWLIDQVGMTGVRIGDAEVSSQHGNFFLNRGNARAQDLITLISLVKMKVRDTFGIELHEEVQYLGF